MWALEVGWMDTHRLSRCRGNIKDISSIKAKVKRRGNKAKLKQRTEGWERMEYQGSHLNGRKGGDGGGMWECTGGNSGDYNEREFED